MRITSGLNLERFAGLRSVLAKPSEWVQNCDMKHTMSDDELRRAIREIRDRAHDARKRGDDVAAEELDRTVKGYQEQMMQRL